MADQDKIKIKGKVMDCYPNGAYKVLLENNV